MERAYYVREALPRIIEKLNAALADGLKDLLETKHVYQKISIDAAAAFKEYEGRIYGDDDKLFADTRNACLNLSNMLVSDREVFSEAKDARSPILTLVLKSVKLFCSACDSKEAFRPVWWTDATNELRKPASRERLIGSLPPQYQLFAIAYQCQRCTGTPHGFLVRRENWALYLDGRSPFEEIEIPAFIPRAERNHYRDAVIATHGGKILAALFYLRTFIEVFARRQTNLPGRVTGDDLMSAYAETLPQGQRDHMPSLREWYERLSEALHAAREDTALLYRAREEIDRHFEFRRLFRIGER